VNARGFAAQRSAADAVLLLVAFGLWRVFFPGLLSADSVAQLHQAHSGAFNDWHPPLMSAALRLVLLSGGGVGQVTFVQCLAGVFGFARLGEELILLLRPAISPRRARSRGAAVALLMLLPWTPSAFYLMTLWKDVWAAILVLWLGVLVLRSLRAGPAPGRTVAAGLVVVALGMIRHNAVAALPAAGLAWAAIRWPGRWRAALAAAVAAPLVALVAGEALARALEVRELRPYAQIQLLDLVGVCVEDPAACRKAPYVRSVLRAPDLAERYVPGDLMNLLYAQPPLVDRAALSRPDALARDYREVLREHPLQVAEVKLEAFVQLLGIERTSYFVHTTVVENPYGLRLQPQWEPTRARLAAVTSAVVTHPLGRWLGGVHVVWIVVGVVFAAAVARARSEPLRTRRRALLALLAVPLLYAASYLLATPVHDFRFLYPATAAIQTVLLAYGAAQIPIGRAPRRATVPA
jgi:hypothetical protein